MPTETFTNPLTDAGTWKFIGGVVLGFCVRNFVAPRDPLPAAKSRPKVPTRPALAVPRPREELKMVLCVNNGLKMGKGKIGAQCAHAAVGVIDRYRRGNEQLFRQWEMGGQAKVALKVSDEHEMAELAHKAMAQGLPTYIVHDAGRTQIAAGSQTVLAVGPGPKSVVDRVTGHLSLL